MHKYICNKCEAMTAGEFSYQYLHANCGGEWVRIGNVGADLVEAAQNAAVDHLRRQFAGKPPDWHATADSLAIALATLLRATEPPKHPLPPTRLTKLQSQHARDQAYGVLADYEAMP